MFQQILETRQVNRRELVKLLGAGTVAAMGISIAGPAFADAKATDAAVMKATGGKKPTMGKVTLETPQIAENGSTVPIGIKVDSAMSGADSVKSVHLYADGNPNPDVATFHFTEMSGKADISTRIRLAKTQNVVAVAEMGDGSFMMAKAEIKVTIGGCGG